MVLVGNSYDKGVYKRLLDHCSRTTPWSRQLWRLSSILEIEELLEAGRARHEGVLSDTAVKYLSDGLVNRVKRDVGLGTVRQRGILVGHINRRLEPDGHDAFALRMLADRTNGDYLRRWADEVRRCAPDAEVVARAVGSHLLDAGYNQNALHKWWTYQGRYAPGAATVADLIEEAESLAARPPISFTILVPLLSRPPLAGVPGGNWIDAHAASEWLAQWVPEAATRRQYGALVLELQARDSYSAIDSASAVIARLEARFRVGARQRLVFDSELFIVGYDEALAYAPSPRRVKVYALQKTNAIFDLALSADISSALELLEPLDLGTPAAAVTGSWAAMEALFIGPGDGRTRVTAATRMARIVACSYIRAELSSLANAYAATDDTLGQAIRQADRNANRVRLFEDALRSGVPVTFAHTRARLGAGRMADLIARPEVVLPRLVGQLEDAFRRLYRQRNLIVHAGDLTSVALSGTLRTVAPLVGAGVDRVVHASAVSGRSPLEVAAMAEVNLARVGEGDARLVELLG